MLAGASGPGRSTRVPWGMPTPAPNPTPVPSLTRIYETVLYVDDLRAADAFYGGVLGLTQIRESADLLDGFRLPSGGVLLVFNARESIKPGRGIPSHGAAGPGHIAFSVGAGGLAAWRARLAAAGVAIEQEHEWKPGVRSVYVRDPAGNSVELVEGEIWPG